MGFQIDLQAQEIRHLSKTDPVMRRLIHEIGPCTLTPRMRRSPFESLARAIAYQQLHEKAAESILKRFVALFPGRRFPRPAELLAAIRTDQAFGIFASQGAGPSRSGRQALDGTVPTGRVIRTLGDDAIVERLIEVRGIGRWTVEMLLIFQLGRPDVLPVDDFGVRNGFRIAYGSSFHADAERGVTIRRALETPPDGCGLVSLACRRSCEASHERFAEGVRFAI